MCKKKVKSFNLSNEAFNIIENYKNENRLGSNSISLEKILLDEYDAKDKINEEGIRRIVEKALKEKKLVIDETENKVEDENKEIVVDEVMKSSIANMKELFKNMN